MKDKSRFVCNMGKQGDFCVIVFQDRCLNIEFVAKCNLEGVKLAIQWELAY